MMFVAAFDGGGTKTRCLIGDTHGRILSDRLGGPSNHQACGPEETKRVLEELLETGLIEAGIQKSDLTYAHLGLAGADLPEDFDMLYGYLGPLFQDIPYKIVNDAWIIMRSGMKSTWGAVCICGTGSNAGAAHPDGRQFILRSLGYSLGNYGGGGDIANEALHHAFRADEWTGPKTLLQHRLPDLLGAKDMDDLVSQFYPDSNPATQKKLKQVPPLVFELASQGDSICQDILIRMGDILGQMTAGVIKRVEMETMDIPVVLGGSIFHGRNPLLIDAFTLALHRTAPKAKLHLPLLPPAAGAYLYALDAQHIECGPDLYERLDDFFCKK